MPLATPTIDHDTRAVGRTRKIAKERQRFNNIKSLDLGALILNSISSEECTPMALLTYEYNHNLIMEVNSTEEIVSRIGSQVILPHNPLGQR